MVCSRNHWTLLLAGSLFILSGLDATAGTTSAAENCWTMGPAQFSRGIEYCVSSVLEPRGEITYGPQNIADGKESTAWCEGEPGSGAGQTIEMRIDDGAEFRRLLINNGYGKSAKTFRGNGRLKTIEVSVDDGVAQRTTLPDTHDIAVIDLPRVGRHKRIKMTIIETYAGEDYDDTCVDYLSPDFEYEEALSHPSMAKPQPAPVPAVAPEGPPPETTAERPPADTANEGPPPDATAGRPSTDTASEGPPPDAASEAQPAGEAASPFGDLGLPSDADLELKQ